MPHSEVEDPFLRTKDPSVNKKTRRQSRFTRLGNVFQKLRDNVKLSSELDVALKENGTLVSRSDQPLKPYDFTTSFYAAAYRLSRGLPLLAVYIFTGLVIGVVATLMGMCTDLLSQLHHFVYDQLHLSGSKVYFSVTSYMSFTMLCCFIAGCIVQLLAPDAGYGGLCQLKAYMSGFKSLPFMNDLLSVKTTVARIVCAVLLAGSGVSIGKETALIVVGAAVSYQVSRLFPALKKHRHLIVTGGVAAGFSAAFGAPLAALLFSLEEITRRRAIFRDIYVFFFASALASVTMYYGNSLYRSNVSHSTFLGSWGMAVPRIVVSHFVWSWQQLVVFFLLGATAGLVAVFFNYATRKLQAFRNKVFEDNVWFHATIIGLFNALGFLLPLLSQEAGSVIQMLFTAKEQHDKKHLDVGYLAQLLVVKFLLSAVTYGQPMTGGLIFPLMMVGALYGRFYGQVISEWIPDWGTSLQYDQAGQVFSWTETALDPALCAVVGAGAIIAGATQSTFTAAVLVVEVCGTRSAAAPALVACMAARVFRNFFGQPSYDQTQYEDGAVPYVHFEPPHISNKLTAESVMTRRVVCVPDVLTAKALRSFLYGNFYYSFPVVSSETNLIFGSVTRDKLSKRLAAEGAGRARDKHGPAPPSPSDDARVIRLVESDVSREMLSASLDTPLDIVYDMFKSLTLQSLIVTDGGEVAGIITHRDLCRRELRVSLQPDPAAADAAVVGGGAAAHHHHTHLLDAADPDVRRASVQVPVGQLQSVLLPDDIMPPPAAGPGSSGAGGPSAAGKRLSGSHKPAPAAPAASSASVGKSSSGSRGGKHSRPGSSEARPPLFPAPPAPASAAAPSVSAASAGGGSGALAGPPGSSVLTRARPAAPGRGLQGAPQRRGGADRPDAAEHALSNLVSPPPEARDVRAPARSGLGSLPTRKDGLHTASIGTLKRRNKVPDNEYFSFADVLTRETTRGGSQSHKQRSRKKLIDM